MKWPVLTCPPRSQYVVYVRNVGCVWNTYDEIEAWVYFRDYVKEAIDGTGPAAGQIVELQGPYPGGQYWTLAKFEGRRHYPAGQP
jgi:hypothetical protein